jgi:uncharacterized protein (DUF58 family)
LLTALAAWTALSIAVVFLPSLSLAAAAGLFLLIGVAGWDAWLAMQILPLQVHRVIPERLYVGRDATLRVSLRSPNQRALQLTLLDEVAPDVHAGELRFEKLPIAPHGTVDVDYTVQPQRRGDRPFGTLALLIESPLRFWWRRSLQPGSQSLRVYPDTTPLLQSLDPKRMLAALGARPAAQRGAGMEFESLRDYVPGDDPRRLDWAASARRGRPVTRQYQHERNHSMIVAIDASRLLAGQVDGRSKLDFTIDAGLALTYAGLASGDRVGMIVFDDQVSAQLAPRSHRRAFGQFVDVLRTVQPRLVEPDFRAVVRQLMVVQRQRALVVVLSVFVEAATAALTDPLLVLARRHRVLLVATRDPLYRDEKTSTSDRLQLYRRLVINDLLNEREAALAKLRRGGLQTLDLYPEQLTAAVLNRYLALRDA